MARFFVDRPVFATVLSVVIVLLGLVALWRLPIAQYPEVAPPTVSISAVYPGANAQVVADTVATPIEQEVNGVENMLYMSSRCTNDGTMTLDVTFHLGTDVDLAQVQVQNRVAIAEAKLPEEVRRQGVTVKKKSTSLLLAVNVLSPTRERDQLFLSNYSTTQIRDELARVDGVGDVVVFGARDFSMRIWLDPDRLTQLGMSVSDVLNALREQNVQVAAGRLGQPPAPPDQQFQLTVRTQGRLLEPNEFADVIVKRGADGQIVRIRDIGRAELGAKNYDSSSYIDGQECAMLGVFQLPGSNALATADAVRATMERLKQRFPDGVDYRIVYDTTTFIEESVHEVYKTLFEAFLLVFIVVLVFLQDWKATLLPMIDVPVSLIGTFFVMALLGFSLNNLSLFGLVLAIGIVVDDAIVVVENIERWISRGLQPREATLKAMAEITGPVIAITLVLSCVFIPTAFIAGISGQFYRQFALTIATATIISAINALTMAPARAVLIFRPHGEGDPHAKSAMPWWAMGILLGAISYFLLGEWFADLLGGGHHGEQPAAEAWRAYLPLAAAFLLGAIPGALFVRPINAALRGFFVVFNAVFGRITHVYGRFVARIVRFSVVMLLVYIGLMGLTVWGFRTVPIGFIPEQDKGYVLAVAQLPDGASLERTEDVMREMLEIAQEIDGVAHVLTVPGYNLLTGVNAANAGGMWIILDPFHERAGVRKLSANAILRQLRMKFMGVQSAQIAAFGAAPVEGVGNASGFKLQVKDMQNLGTQELQNAVDSMIEVGGAQPGLVGLFTTYRANQPQVFAEIDREKAKSLNVSLTEINNTLQTYLGSAYVNDFTMENRNWQVQVQAESKFRLQPSDIGKLRARSDSGAMIPLATLINVTEISGPAVVNRYQMFPSAEISGGTLPGTSSGDAIAIMEGVARQTLPRGMDFEWTELTLQQIQAGNTAVFVFILGTVLVFLVLAAQYESWSLPMAIIMIVPMCLLSAIAGVFIMQQDNNIFTQIGLVVLIGLAAKNAILIVEFAKQRQEGDGLSRREAVVDACRVRLRPIIMTSLAFMLGVLPLLLGKGAGFEMRFALGLAVFSGMLGVTGFGLIFTPVFYDLIVGWVERARSNHVGPTKVSMETNNPSAE